MKEMKLDCSACKTDKVMEATKIPKFPGFIRFIGFLIAIPSVLGVLFAILMFFSTGSATNEVMSSAQSDAEAAGVAIGSVLVRSSILMLVSGLTASDLVALSTVTSPGFQAHVAGTVVPY